MKVRLHATRYVGAFPRIETPKYVIFGQDGGQSIDLLDDRVLFLFSDTLVVSAEPSEATTADWDPGPPRPHTGGCEVFLPNCAAVAPKRSYKEALAALEYLEGGDGLPRQLLPALARERFQRIRFWPEHGVRIGDFVYLYYVGVQTVDPSSSWGFRAAGAGLARVDVATLNATRLTRQGDWRLWETNADDLHFGVCVRHDADYVYVYFSTRDGLAMKSHLARVKAAAIEELEAYEYLTSSSPTWSPERADAVSLGECAPEYTVHYNRHLHKYVMLYIDSFLRVIKLRTADAWWGPFSAPQSLIRVPSDPKSELIYLGFEQAAFEEREGRRVFFSYSQPHFTMNSSVVLDFA